jgi:hypothetical protein
MRYSMSGGSTPPNAKTFSVDYFTVRAPLADPNYGQLVTEGLKDLLLNQTRLSLADANGDIHFEGEVSRYEIIPVAASGDEISTRNRLTIDIKLRYFNTLEPEKDKQLTLSQFEDFEAGDDFGTVEETLIESINEKILQDIYDRTLGDW